MFRSHSGACSTETFGLSLDQIVNDLFVCIKYLARYTVSVLCVSVRAISYILCQSEDQSGGLWELHKWWKSRKPCERLVIVRRYPCLIWRAQGRGAGAKRETGEGSQHHRGGWAAKEHHPQQIEEWWSQRDSSLAQDPGSVPSIHIKLVHNHL